MKRRLIDHPISQLVGARLRELTRTPEALFWGYMFPLVMVVSLGLAFRSKPVETFNVDVQAGQYADGVKAALAKDEQLRVEVNSADDCRLRLRTGKVDLVVVGQVVVGQGRAGGLASESESDPQPDVEYQYDPTRPGSLMARDAADRALQADAGRKDVLQTVNQEVSEPGSRYIDFLVPGLIGMGLMGGGLWGMGFAIVDMRIRQVLKRYMGTPMKKGHFLMAMTLSRMAFVIPEMTFLLTFSWLFFGVVSHGCYFTLVVLIVLGAFQFASIGLLIASRTQTMEGAMGLMNMITIPMWVGGGIFFEPSRFPDFAQPVLNVLPLYPLIKSFRMVMLEGAGWVELAPQIGIVAAWAGVTFLLALKRFRWD